MNRWLVKSDPEDYSAADLERDRHTTWDGVSNALAQRHIKAMAKGDSVLVYQTGKDKAVVALAKVAGNPRPDPRSETPQRGVRNSTPSSSLFVVDLSFDRWLDNPVSLAAIKSDPSFKDFALVRISRLSVMPVTSAEWERILAMST